MTIWSGGGGWASASLRLHSDGTATLHSREHRQGVTVKLSALDTIRLAELLAVRVRPNG